MSENEDLDAVRKEMLDLLEAGKTVTEWSKERPTDWRPTSVINPNPGVGMPFTHRTCWHFIEELLQGRHPVEVIDLMQPRGEKGYVMLFETESGTPDIYVKLQVCNGRLIGRSFHYSKYQSKRSPKKKKQEK